MQINVDQMKQIDLIIIYYYRINYHIEGHRRLDVSSHYSRLHKIYIHIYMKIFQLHLRWRVRIVHDKIIAKYLHNRRLEDLFNVTENKRTTIIFVINYMWAGYFH